MSLAAAAGTGGRGTAGPEIVSFSAPPVLTAAGQEPTGTDDARKTETAELEGMLQKVGTPDFQLLVQALGLDPRAIGEKAVAADRAGLEEIGDLDGDGVPEAVLKWTPSEHGKPAGEGEGTPPAAPTLYLLTWNGSAWVASRLLSTPQPILVRLLPAEAKGPRAFAVIVVKGATQIAYPVIFKFRDHQASMIWDGRSDDTYYQGLPFGAAEFRAGDNEEIPEMMVSGLADPGLLIFPKEPSGVRGFQARTLYLWKGAAYFPAQTEYSATPDYTLYRFIAALHLHDFKAAYDLIDVRKFFNTDKPSIDLFRQQVEKEWPEFLDDQVFEAASETGEALAGNAFELRVEGEVKAFYQPSFGPGPAYLLTGLERSTPK